MKLLVGLPPRPGRALGPVGGGGLGQEIEIEVVSPEPLHLSLLSDRQKHVAQGSLGGSQGARSLNHAVLDAALLGPAVLPAIRDGGQLMCVRPFQGETERDIKVSLVLVDDVAVGDYVIVHVGYALNRLDHREAELTLQQFRQVAYEAGIPWPENAA